MRKQFSPRTRRALIVALGAASALFVVLGIAIVHSNPTTPPRAVTIPLADRSASAALIRAAEAVNYRPATLSGVGEVEGKPASAEQPPTTNALLPVGMKAPGFTLQTPTGRAYSLRDFRGKAVLLEFFATWCPHCAAEAPHLAKLYASLPHDRFAFVSVDADSESAPTVFAYHVWFGLPFPALVDTAGRKVTFPDHGPIGPVAAQYHLNAYPTFYVIDPRGKIAWRTDGEQPDALLAQELRRAARPLP